MEPIVSQALRRLDCDDKAIAIYMVAARLGEASAPQLARYAKVRRATAYMVIAELTRRGLLLADERSYGRRYMAAPPEQLLRLLAAEQRKLGKSELALKEALPTMRDLYKNLVIRPRLQVLEGDNGLRTIWQDILSSKQEVLLWTNQVSEQYFFSRALHEQFIAERTRKQIALRVLAVDNPQARQLCREDATSFRQTRLLPVDVQFTSETYIYGDKVAILDANAIVFGLIIDNPQVAAAQRAQFEFAWAAL